VVGKTKLLGRTKEAFYDWDVPVGGAFIGHPMDCHEDTAWVRVDNGFPNFASEKVENGFNNSCGLSSKNTSILMKFEFIGEIDMGNDKGSTYRVGWFGPISKNMIGAVWPICMTVLLEEFATGSVIRARGGGGHDGIWNGERVRRERERETWKRVGAEKIGFKNKGLMKTFY
jgi:hypothetical protein